MAEGKLGAVESRFADIVWAHAPLASRSWRGSASRSWVGSGRRRITFCVSSAREVFFRTTAARSGALVSREAFYCSQGEALVDSAFGGSLPAFLAAFTKRRALSRSEIEKIQKMIDEAEA